MQCNDFQYPLRVCSNHLFIANGMKSGWPFIRNSAYPWVPLINKLTLNGLFIMWSPLKSSKKSEFVHCLVPIKIQMSIPRLNRMMLQQPYLYCVGLFLWPYHVVVLEWDTLIHLSLLQDFIISGVVLRIWLSFLNNAEHITSLNKENKLYWFTAFIFFVFINVTLSKSRHNWVVTWALPWLNKKQASH